MLKPQPWQIIPRLFWPALFISLFFGLSAWSYPLILPSRFTEHWFRNATMLKAVHSLVLGQLGLTFLAVTVQALPVLFHLPHAWKELSAWGLSLWIFGVLMLVSFFAGWRNPYALLSALAALASAWALLYRQAIVLSSSSEATSFAWDGLGPAFFYLGLMIALGGAMAWGLMNPLLPQDPFVTLRLHLHLGLWGVAGLAIFGFLPKLLRLFQASVGYPGWPLKVCMGATQAGLAALLYDWLRPSSDTALRFAALCFGGSALMFCLQLIFLMGASRARRLDSSLAMHLAALIFLLTAAAFDAKLLWSGGDWRLQGAALALGLGGFVSLTILGTLQRISAVLAWFHRFYQDAQSMAVPTAWGLTHPFFAWIMLPLQSGAAALLAWGLWQGNAGVIQTAGALGCLAQLSAIALAIGCLTRGKAEPFPGGVNPFAEWLKEQQQNGAKTS